MGWRSNLVEKLGSLITAVLLVLYVQSQLHPIIEQTYEIPIEMLNAPPNYEVSLVSGNRVRVTVRGMREAVETTSANQIRATIDLRNARPGENSLPIRLQYPTEWERSLTITAERQRARVSLEQRLTRQMSIRVVLSGTPDLQEVLAEAIPEPGSVRITGPASAVHRVRAVQVSFDMTGLQGDMEVDAVPTPVSAEGEPVLNLQVNPAQVRLKLNLVPQPTSKTVPISPRLGDLPRFPYRVVWFSVEPVAVQLRGSPARLADISVLETQPISLRNFTQDAQVRVALKVPPGVEVVGSREVTVQVRITREEQPAPPQPSEPKPPTDKETEKPAPDEKEGN